MAATSGTVGTYPYDQRKVIEHAMRRAGKVQTSLGGEWIQIARDLIFTTLAEWIAAQKPIWTKQYQMLGIQPGSPNVLAMAGTDSVKAVYWRQLEPYRGAALTTAGADASVLFGGQPNADLVIPGPNAGVIVNFGSATEVDTIGVLLGGAAAVTAQLQVLTSPDGVAYTLSQSLPLATYTPGQWTYFDLDPTVVAQYVKLILPGGSGSGVPILTETGLDILTEAGQAILTETGGAAGSAFPLNQLNFGLSGGDDLQLGELNEDDYYTLPDKLFRGQRPNSVFVDRPIGAPLLLIWPVPDVSAFYNGCITLVAHRYIQDPGEMTNAIEVQTRFIEALQWRLAQKLIYELPDEQGPNQQSYFTLMAKQQRITNIETNATRAESLAWAAETTGGPLRIAPNISGYTR